MEWFRGCPVALSQPSKSDAGEGDSGQSISQPVEGVTEQTDQILSGWVGHNCFAVGDSGECFSFVKDW